MWRSVSCQKAGACQGGECETPGSSLSQWSRLDLGEGIPLMLSCRPWQMLVVEHRARGIGSTDLGPIEKYLCTF